jgi:sulfur dioxygenase
MRIGLAQNTVADRGWALTADEVKRLLGQKEVALIDLRETQERRRDGVIPGSLHVAYPDVQENLQPDGLLRQLVDAGGKQLVFYCAYGERSAMALQAAQAAGLTTARHLHGGMQAWKNAEGPLAI